MRSSIHLNSTPFAADFELLTASSQTTRTFRIKLVTPMFGGGVEKGVIDKAMPFRAKAIRGQLRFWWRVAVAAGAIKKPDDAPAGYPSVFLWTDATERDWENWVFGGQIGGTLRPQNKGAQQIRKSLVHVAAVSQAIAHLTPYIADARNKYALFPAERMGVIPAKQLRMPTPASDTDFELHLSYPESVSDAINSALELWFLFGGVGSRTRRGCGHMRVSELVNGKVESIPQLLLNASARQKIHGVDVYLGGGLATPEAAWHAALAKMATFRGGMGAGRESKKGLSSWPEPQNLREILGQHWRENGASPITHSKPGRALKQDAGRKITYIFPRVAFGAPIRFFPLKESVYDKNKPDAPLKYGKQGDRDPINCVANIEGKNRLASPVIVTVVKVGSAFHSAIVLLPWWQDALNLKVNFEVWRAQAIKNRTDVIWLPNTWSVEPTTLRTLMLKDGNAKDPITAFIDYFLSKP